MVIRRETDADIADIDAVHRAAFSRSETDTEPPEVQLLGAVLQP